MTRLTRLRRLMPLNCINDDEVHVRRGSSFYGLHTFRKLLVPPMDLLRWMGHAKTSFHHSPHAISVVLDSGSKVTLPELCRSVTPPCKLNPFLFNGHLQTMWTVVRTDKVPIYYKRRVFEAENPAYVGSFAVDFVVRRFEEHDPSLPPRTVYFRDNDRDGGPDGPKPSDDARPMVVALHGLSGGSHELYLRHVLAPLVSEEAGWEACVVNARGCARSKVTSKVLFNARATWDMRQIVKWLRQRYPNRPLFGVGFSLGANILVNVRPDRASPKKSKKWPRQFTDIISVSWRGGA